jgi:hypothetical protein
VAASVTLEIKMLPVTAAAVSFGAVSSMVDRYNNRFEKMRSRGSGLTSILRHHLTAAFWLWASVALAVYLLYEGGVYPLQQHPFSVLSGILTVYAWKANRPDTLALIAVAYSMFLVFDSGVLQLGWGALTSGWGPMWNLLRSRLGWLVLGGIGSGAVLQQIGFPVRFLPRTPRGLSL